MDSLQTLAIPPYRTPHDRTFLTTDPIAGGDDS